MVGEGRADAPVGTTLAMIEQAKMILNSVHKRMHTAQAEEFALLKQCFREHPESFYVRIKRPTVQWNEQLLIQALDDCDLVPQADPNTASHTQRVMKIMALKQLQQANPGLYDPIAIDMAALRAMGWSNPEQFMAPISAQGKMPPEMEQKIAELQIKKQDADTRAMVAQATVAEKMGGGEAGGEPDPMKMADLQVRQQEIEQKETDAKLDAINRQRDRESRERLAAVRLAEDIVKNPNALPVLGNILDPSMIQRLESNEQPLPIGE
jgi:hypothetical protein